MGAVGIEGILGDSLGAANGGRSIVCHAQTSILNALDCRNTNDAPARGDFVVMLFGLTLFVSATLLFLVEPMFAKMALPLLGGTPAVWNTCMVFFQAALLAGYAYAHLLTSYARPSRQIAVHLALVAVALVSLPIAIAHGWSPPLDANPTLWLLLLLTVSVGLPFLVISTSAPVLQKWFSRTSHPAAKDPYFLYAASNLGSIVGLLGYLVVLEPHYTLSQQGRIWTGGYVGLMILVGACAAWSFASARGNTRERQELSEPDLASTDRSPISVSRRLRWIALAFAPSSLMLGVTTYLTTDIASVPLLWVVPLTLYLLTFMLAFARRRVVPLTWFPRTLPFLALMQMVLMAKYVVPWTPVLHLLTFFVVAMSCHGELADDRPPPRHLTEFYLLLAVGGVLGGIFNAIVAPLVFNSVLEYPLVLVFACMLCLKLRAGAARPSVADAIWPLLLGSATAGVLLGARAYGLDRAVWLLAALLGAATLACYTMVERPIRFGLGLGAVVLAIGLVGNAGEQTLHQERTFFGVLRVKADSDRNAHSLVHGTTLHGMQCMTPSKRREPLTYYALPGDIFRAIGQASNVALLGLGTGTLACYADRGQSFTFYEIDPAVERIAANPAYFTFIGDAEKRGAHLKVILGDGRLTIATAEPGGYDLIVLDAFSSDSIPMHLLTRQAVKLYLSKLSDGGLLAIHISNRRLNLKPVVAALAADAGLVCYIRDQRSVSRSESERGVSPSTWAVAARQASDLGDIARDRRWRRATNAAHAPVWTDDFSNILDVIKWRR